MSLTLSKREMILVNSLLQHAAKEEFYENIKLEAEERAFDENTRDLDQFSQAVERIDKSIRLEKIIAANLKNRISMELR